MRPIEELEKNFVALKEEKEKYEQVYQEMEREMEEIRKRYEGALNAHRAAISSIDKTIRSILKAHKEEIFGKEVLAEARRELKHGVVYWRKGRWVKRVRGVLAKLKELGWTEAIKVTESVRWDIIEEWPDDRLRQLGTQRVLKESLEYEVK